jgi:hypothetical protein
LGSKESAGWSDLVEHLDRVVLVVARRQVRLLLRVTDHLAVLSAPHPDRAARQYSGGSGPSPGFRAKQTHQDVVGVVTKRGVCDHEAVDVVRVGDVASVRRQAKVLIDAQLHIRHLETRLVGLIAVRCDRNRQRVVEVLDLELGNGVQVPQ